MDIHEALNKMQPSTSFVAQLKKFLGGPIMLVDEKSPSMSLAVPALNCSSRRYWRTLAYLSVSIRLLICSCLSHRIQSVSNVSDRFRTRRLHGGFAKEFNNWRNSIKLMKTAEEFWLSAFRRSRTTAPRLLPARDASDLDSKAFAVIDQFRQRHERHWREALSSGSVAVLLHLRAPSPVERSSLLTIATHAGWVALDFPNSNGRETLQQIAAPIERVCAKSSINHNSPFSLKQRCLRRHQRPHRNSLVGSRMI